MSADNWAICPRCLERAQGERTEAKACAAAAYGHVPVEEFQALHQKVDFAFDPEHFRSFREDYEIGVRRGKFIVAYRGNCEHCGLSHQFNHAEAVA